MDNELTDAILANLYDVYTIDGAEETGQSISFLKKTLNQSGWKGLGNLDDFRQTCEALGFSHKQGTNRRGQSAWVVFA